MNSTRPDAETSSLIAWVGHFVGTKPLTTCRKVNEWQSWAIYKLDRGWSHDAIKDRIRAAWDEWVRFGNVDLEPMPRELVTALGDVFQMAQSGSTPAACAVVYRALARDYPARTWLEKWADRWEHMGDKWSPV